MSFGIQTQARRIACARARPGLLWLLAIAALWASGCQQPDDRPRVEAGRIDLSAWSPVEDGLTALTGHWEICWGELVTPPASDCRLGWKSVPVPRLWSEAGSGSPIGGRGVATYRIRMVLPRDREPLELFAGSPMTSFRVWIDGEERGGAGVVGASQAASVPKLDNQAYALPEGGTPIEVVTQVANFDFRGGGLRRLWYVGTAEQIEARTRRNLLVIGAFATASLVVGLLFLTQWLLHPADRARGWFGLAAVLIGLRMVFANLWDFYLLVLPSASFDFLLRGEYLGSALVIAAGVAYFRAKVPGVMPPRITQVLQLAALGLVPVILLGSLPAAQATLPGVLILSPIVIGLVVWSYGTAWWRGVPGVGTTLAMSLVWCVGIAHDVIRTSTGIGLSIEVFPYFMVAALVSETHAMLQSHARAYTTAEQLSEELQDANLELQEAEEAVVRFVPFDLLRALGKRGIGEVHAGDHAISEATAMTCGLERVEVESSEQGFARLRDLVAVAAPLIQSRGGFVCQPQAESVLALFPDDGARDAVEVALEVCRAQERRGTGQGARIGIATGSVLVGTVGDGQQLSSTVMGPAVETSRRIQDSAVSLGVGLLISEATRRRLVDPVVHETRQVGTVASPGTDDAVTVHEVPLAGAPGKPDSEG